MLQLEDWVLNSSSFVYSEHLTSCHVVNKQTKNNKQTKTHQPFLFLFLSSMS